MEVLGRERDAQHLRVGRHLEDGRRQRRTLEIQLTYAAGPQHDAVRGDQGAPRAAHPFPVEALARCPVVVVGDRGLQLANVQHDPVGAGLLELGLIEYVTGEELAEESHGVIVGGADRLASLDTPVATSFLGRAATRPPGLVAVLASSDSGP
jgi:hypothetical protein